MRTSLIFALFWGIISCGGGNQEKDKTAVPYDKTEELARLRYLKKVEWPKAYKDQDTLLLDKILGDDFKMIAADGSRSDKDKQMVRLKSAPMAHDSFWYDISRLEILDNGTAIIAGTGHMVNDSVETLYESSNVLVFRKGEWKAVLSHVSGIRPKELN